MPNRINPDVVARQTLENKGITDAVGTYGDHKVRIGDASPINLANIKANKVPFAGFKTATKVARGREGLQKNAADTLKTLNRPGGKLNAKELLGSLKALQVNFDRLDALGQIPPSFRDDSAMLTFGPHVEHMSNAELAAVYQNFTSAEMELLQTALTREGQLNPDADDARNIASQLFDLQAMVLREVSVRVAAGEVFNAKGDISSSNLRTLVNTGAQSATTRERTAGEVKQGLETRKIDGISARQMGDVLRSAELTVNISPEILLGDNSIIANPDKPMKNIFHLAAENVLPKGEGYLSQRDAAERLLFPEFEGHELNPDERPLYGALNVSRREIGAVPLTAGYGTAAIVLKPEVAQRSTYMAEDTFYSPVLDISAERRENFYALLDGVAGEHLSPAFVEECRDPNSAKHAALEVWFNALADTPDLRASAFRMLPNELDLDGEGQEVFTAHLLQCFGDPAATRSTMATYDNLEALIPNMETVTSNSIARAVEDSSDGNLPRVHLAGVQYIEAQIHGPIVPSRDIAEVRIDINDIPLMEREETIARLTAFAQKTGVPVKVINYDMNSEVDALNDLSERTNEFNKGHWDPNKISAATTALEQNVQEKIIQTMGADAELREMIPLFIDQEVVRGNALGKMMSKFHAAVESLQNDPNRSFPSEESLVNAAFAKAATPVIKLKAELMQELENLHFETPQQKEAFAHWALSAKALRSPEELRIIHTHATAMADTLADLGNRDPQPTADEVFQHISVVNDAAGRDLDTFIASLHDDDFGADDKANELDRVSFMGIAMLKNGANSDTNLRQVSALFNRPEHEQFMGQMNRVLQVPEIEYAQDYGQLRATTTLVGLTAGNVNRVTGDRASQPQPFTADPALLPEQSRAMLREVCPHVARQIETEHPAYTGFPTVQGLNQLPSDNAGRRDFLINNLDANSDRGHAVRSFIFADAMSNILQNQGIEVDRNAVLCSATLPGDADRPREAMLSQFGQQALGSDYEEALSNAINGNSNHTVEGMLLQSAESLETGITRDFDAERFPFMAEGGDERGMEVDRMRDQLATEADLLQRMTSPLAMHGNAIRHLDEEILNAAQQNNQSAVDFYTEQRNDLMQVVEALQERESQLSAAELVGRYEQVITNNPSLFPLLSANYNS